MGVKGAVNTTIDANALASLIVFANHYSDEVLSAAEEIRTLCRGMEDEESLKGGDGDQIREGFSDIAKGCVNIENSTKYINKVLNDKLGTALNMNKGRTLGEAADKMHSAVNKAGVMKKE